MKPKFKISILFILLHGMIFAQTGLPSVTSVFSDTKANPKVYESLRTKYKITNPKACKIEMKMTIGSGEIVSDWSTYKSQEGERLNYYWPDDRAYTVFTVTTPENTDGVTYSLPLVVEYSRIKNSTLQNNWTYYWWYFDTPYSSKGGKQDPLFQDLLIQYLSGIKGAIYPNDRDGIPSAIEDFTSISKIEKSNEQDLRQNYSNVEHVTRVYSVYGETTKFSDWDNAIAESNSVDCISNLKVEFSRQKENGTEGEWYIENILGGFETGIQSSTVTEDKQLYKTVGSHGFNEIYEKEKQIRALPYFSEVYQNKFSNELTSVLIDIYEKKENGLENLKKFIIPGGDDIFESFKSFFNELDMKFVTLKPSTNSPKHNGLLANLHVEANEVPDGYVTIYTSLDRKSGSSEKGLSKKYKEGGMSKDIINTREGQYYSNENLTFKIAIIDGEIKIASKLEMRKQIPF